VSLSPSRIPLGLALAIVFGSSWAAPAHAVRIGLSDQHAAMFSEPLYRKLHTRYARLVVRWDIAKLPEAARQATADWITAAEAAHVEPHIAFTNAISTKGGLAVGPAPARYGRAFAAFRKRWPSVKVFTPWNEVNLNYQPTAKRPALAAAYYRVLRRHCAGCQVVAADVLDLGNVVSWLREFQRHVSGSPRLWGVHNYRDANYDRPLSQSWTLRLTRMLRGTIWVTEAGGIVGRRDSRSGKLAWPYSPPRAGRAMRHLLELVNAPAVRARYGRLYVYNFYGAWDRHRVTNPWDSGLVGLDGKPRPAYEVLARELKR